jgi:hypothetical protein
VKVRSNAETLYVAAIICRRPMVSKKRPRSVSEYLKYAHSNRKMLCFRQECTTQYGSENEFSDTLLACLIHEG